MLSKKATRDLKSWPPWISKGEEGEGKEEEEWTSGCSMLEERSRCGTVKEGRSNCGVEEGRFGCNTIEWRSRCSVMEEGRSVLCGGGVTEESAQWKRHGARWGGTGDEGEGLRVRVWNGRVEWKSRHGPEQTSYRHDPVAFVPSQNYCASSWPRWSDILAQCSNLWMEYVDLYLVDSYVIMKAGRYLAPFVE
jgi:hypothetical protein